MSKITDLEKQVERLEIERATVAAALGDLETVHRGAAADLAEIQAQAERSGNPADMEAARAAEITDSEMNRAIQRKRAALAAIDRDLEAARAALSAAHRTAQLDRLADLRKQAGKLADQIEAKGFDHPAGWADLQIAHDETIQIIREIFGEISVQGHELLWRGPARGLAIRLNSICRVNLSLQLATVAGLPAQVVDREFTVVPSLRAALGL